MRKTSRILLGVWLAFSACLAFGADLVVQRSWVEDPQGTLTFEQVQHQAQQPLTLTYFNQGFGASVYWIRLRIDPSRQAAASPDTPLVVRIRPMYLDDVQLFDPLAPRTQPRATGDQHTWLQDEYQSLNLNFQIPLGTQPRDIWLRLQTTTSTLSDIQVLPLSEAKFKDWGQVIFSMFLVAVLFVCLLWGILALTLFKDRLIKFYLMRETMALTYAFFVLGGLRMFSANWLEPGTVDSIGNLLFCMYGFALVWFDVHFLADFQPRRWLWNLLRADLWVYAVAIGAVLLGYTRASIWVNSIATTIGIVLEFSVALSSQAWSNPDAQQRPAIPKWFLISMYVLLTALILANRLTASGVISTHYDVFYLLLMYPLVSSVLVLSILQIRASRLQKRQQEMVMRLALAEKEVQSERERIVEQDRFLSMLTHELKTPVSVAKISLDAMNQPGKESERISQALQNITNVVDRCQVSDALENQRLHAGCEEFELRDLLFERISLLTAPERVKVIEGNQAWIHSDCQFVGIIISNLLENALKYSPEDSTITASVEAVSAQVCVRVTNQLGRADRPDEALLFKKYYRAKTAESQSGSGLGLYISQGLTAMLGGHLNYRFLNDHVEFSLCLNA